jgi:hypothetical protein
MNNPLLIKYLSIRDVASARVVGGKHATTAGLHLFPKRNTNKGENTYLFGTLLPHELLVENTQQRRGYIFSRKGTPTRAKI